MFGPGEVERLAPPERVSDERPARDRAAGRSRRSDVGSEVPDLDDDALDGADLARVARRGGTRAERQDEGEGTRRDNRRGAGECHTPPPARGRALAPVRFGSR